MGFIRTAILITSAYGTYRLLTDKDPFTGKTALETFGDRVRDFLRDASEIKENIAEEVVSISHEVDEIKQDLKRGGKRSEPLGDASLDY